MTALREFDAWITPSLGEVRDTPRFADELGRVVRVFDLMSDATDDFADPQSCRPEAIANRFIERVEAVSSTDGAALLEALSAVLFLVTGKSDNNAKCQFPLHLRDEAGWETIPTPQTRGQNVTPAKYRDAPIPRVLKAARFMSIVAGLSGRRDAQSRLLTEFVRFVLDRESCVNQLWSIGRSYVMLKPIDHHKDLLTPLVVFQVRGSVSASGGHDPEALLRSRLEEWGMRPGIDFNTSDVVLDINRTEAGSGNQRPIAGARKKTRAWDFVIPYRTDGWTPSLFVQCQFYAGDSGSVSHKNVDQTSTSRAATLELHPDARFLEYVDGAGYFSALNGDLKNLLSMESTGSFFQIRSSGIRLRRELQQIGFLLPLEVEHAVLRTGGVPAAVEAHLAEEGYDDGEIQRAVSELRQRGSLKVESEVLAVAADRRAIARKYLLMDVAAAEGQARTTLKKGATGTLLVPGYGPVFGIEIDALARESLAIAPALKSDWSEPEVILKDIRELCESGMAMTG